MIQRENAMNISSIHSALTGEAPMSADNPKLKSAAHEFEASLMQEFLKPLQHDPLFAPDKSDGSSDSDGGSDDQGSSAALMSFASEAMAKAISERGGFGIATKILDHFRTEAKAPPSSNICKA
jgi:Rod binding domain-containing protein